MSETKPSVYLETSVISYLTGRLSRNLLVAGYQQSTREWWEEHRQKYSLFISPYVIQEISEGDAEQSRARIDVVRTLSLLEPSEKVFQLATVLIERGALPSKALNDALHLAIATVHNVQFLLSWNYRHIANPFSRKTINQVTIDCGFIPPTICNPNDLLEGEL